MGLFDDVLLTVDFDRTLTAPDSTIPERNLQAISYFMENGGAFTVNTGRSVPMAMHNLMPHVPVNAPLLLYNGSAAWDLETQSLTLCRPIDLPMGQVVRAVQAQFPELTVEIQGRQAHYILHENKRWERYCDHNRCPWAYCPPEEIPGPFLKFSLYGEFRDETVASLDEATEEDLALFDRAIAYIRDNYGDRVDVVRACARIADVHAKGATKAASARALQKRLGRRILVCVGDAENDLTMLQEADFAYCPADGLLADRFETVCPCADGAVADVIYEKIPAILEIDLDNRRYLC